MFGTRPASSVSPCCIRGTPAGTPWIWMVMARIVWLNSPLELMTVYIQSTICSRRSAVDLFDGQRILGVCHGLKVHVAICVVTCCQSRSYESAPVVGMNGGERSNGFLKITLPSSTWSEARRTNTGVRAEQTSQTRCRQCIRSS